MKKENEYIDQETRKLFQNSELEKPSEDFTFQVMNKLEKEKTYGKMSNDNLWQIILAIGLPILYFVFQFLSRGSMAFNGVIEGLKNSNYFRFIKILSESVIQDVTVSPIVFMGIVAILLLLLFDRVIMRMLHSFK